MTQPSPYDLAVLIGRFQPFHNGHAALLQHALALAPKVCVVLGSALQARNAKNPFSWEERAAMIGASLPPEQRDRLVFLPVRDYYDDRRWGAAIQAAVQAHAAPKQRVALAGFVKDASSYYLQRFPGWSLEQLPQQGELDATSVRQIYFDGNDPDVTQALLGNLLPPAIAEYLRGWARLPHYPRLREEQQAIENSRKTWGNGPFITVDAVVQVGEHVLLIQRRHAPGKGLWALPGGFLDGRERVLQGAIRELREETRLGLLDSTLEGALRGSAVFDHPDRSLRGRTVTHAHYFRLDSTHLPEIEADDDAALARWVPLAELPALEDQLFEDHFNILDHFLQLTANPAA